MRPSPTRFGKVSMRVLHHDDAGVDHRADRDRDTA